MQNAENMLHDLKAQHDQVGSGGHGGTYKPAEEGLDDNGGPGTILARTHEESVHQHRCVCMPYRPNRRETYSLEKGNLGGLLPTGVSVSYAQRHWRTQGQLAPLGSL